MKIEAQHIRLKYLFVAVWALLGAFFLRAGWITVIKGAQYSDEAQKNFLLPNTIAASRGLILDRNLNPIAYNLLTYRVGVRPYRLDRDEVASTLRDLSAILDGDFEPFLGDIMTMQPRWNSFELARGLTLEQAAPLLERQDQLPGLRLTAEHHRYYPEGRALSHIVGYTGPIPVERWDQYQLDGYHRYDVVGRTGIEVAYEPLLRGDPGQEIIKRNARGLRLENWIIKTAEPGSSVALTIDIGLQQRMHELMSESQGVAIVMDCNNGEILGMVSCPDYDPNRIALSLNDDTNSFFNKAVQGLYPPGSTLKPLTALAFLRSGGTADEGIVCRGKFYLPGWSQPFNCNNLWGHGSETLASALQHSCNVFFYEAARRAGVKHMNYTAEEFGLTEPTGIDLPAERKGGLGLDRGDNVPGDLLLAGIGQGKALSSPLEIIRFICALANGEHLPVPHLFRGALAPGDDNLRGPDDPRQWEGKRIYLSAPEREAILRGMRWVTQRVGGTAYNANFPPEWDVAGKSGSAESPGDKVDAWFVSFAPAWQPRWGVLVMIEGGGHGGDVAAPVARQMYQYLFDEMY